MKEILKKVRHRLVGNMSTNYDMPKIGFRNINKKKPQYKDKH